MLFRSEASYFRGQMTKEVNAACIGANELSCREILVKDAHGSARSINPSQLPENVKIHRGWARNPHIMMAGIDNSFNATLFIGYHSGSSMNGNPLSHTMHCNYDYIKLNGRVMTEFMMNAYTSIYYNVPVAFVSGDKMLCDDAKEIFPNIVTVPVSEGMGESSISIHPHLAAKEIKEKVKESLTGDLSRHMVKLPEKFEFEIKFRQHAKAYRASFYPTMEKLDSQTVKFVTDDYYEFLRMFLFI